MIGALMRRGFMGSAAAGGLTYATWNPADKAASIVLSNGNLRASAPVYPGLVRATVGKSSGKWYWEITPFFGGGAWLIGAAEGSGTVNLSPGYASNSWGYYVNGAVGTGGSFGGTNDSYTAGDTIGIALDMNSGFIVFYKNGVVQPTPLSGLAGTVYPAFGTNISGTTIADANFGATAFAYPVPSGYNAGIYL